jgi:hypothetical protein
VEEIPLTKPLAGKWRVTGRVVCWFACCAPAVLLGQQPNVQQIIEKSVAANQADFRAATRFNWIETDRSGRGAKRFQVTMIEGTPYYRLLEVNGKALTPAREAQQKRKEQQVMAERRSETREQRQKRIETFEKERRRDNAMIDQLTKAFSFTMVGLRKVRGYSVYVLKATPLASYKPPTMETQVLTGMHGELWIEEKTFHWVKVTAQVIHAVSIEGFLAEVEPGTQFELDNGPVGDGSTWQAAHFAMRSNSKVLHLFTRESSEEETYTDYQPADSSSAGK